MQDEGTWGSDDDLATGWWHERPPNAILRVTSKDSQLALIGVVSTTFGYDSQTSYVFGAQLGPDRFYTGYYNSGPVAAALIMFHRRPKPVYVAGFRLTEQHAAQLRRYAGRIERVDEVAGTLELLDVPEMLPDDVGEPAGALLSLVGVVDRVWLNPLGFRWPPEPEGDGWAPWTEPTAD